MTTRHPLVVPSKHICRVLLDCIKARDKARAQAAESKAKRDEDRAENGRSVTEEPLHDLMEDIQFHHTPSNFAHSSTAAAGVYNLSSALQLMTITKKTENPATDVFVTTVPENKLFQNLQRSPFLKLPPEVRCLIYEQAILDIIEEAEALALLTRKSKDRYYRSVRLRAQVNALPHTCCIIRKECAPIYEVLSHCAIVDRIRELEDLIPLETDPGTFGTPWARSQELEDFIDLETNTKSRTAMERVRGDRRGMQYACSMRYRQQRSAHRLQYCDVAAETKASRDRGQIMGNLHMCPETAPRRSGRTHSF